MSCLLISDCHTVHAPCSNTLTTSSLKNPGYSSADSLLSERSGSTTAPPVLWQIQEKTAAVKRRSLFAISRLMVLHSVSPSLQLADDGQSKRTVVASSYTGAGRESAPNTPTVLSIHEAMDSLYSCCLSCSSRSHGWATVHATPQVVKADRSLPKYGFTLSLFAFFQETMTEPSVYTEDVCKLKDADELKQACIGLKDTNRYFVMAGCPLHSKARLHPPSFVQILPGCWSFTNFTIIYKKSAVVNAALSCADLQDSCVIAWKSVISWVGWGNQWDVADASQNRACMATLVPNTVKSFPHGWNRRWKRWVALTACGIM